MAETTETYKTLPAEIANQLRARDDIFQNKNFTIVTTAPTLKTIDRGQIQLYWDGGTFYLYTRRVDTLYQAALTAI